MKSSTFRLLMASLCYDDFPSHVPIADYDDMKSFLTKRSGASACHLYGKSSNSDPERIQMERLIPVEWFRKKKVIPSEVFPSYRNSHNFLYRFLGLPAARHHVERKRKIYLYFVNGNNSIPFLFSVRKKKYQYHLTKNIPRKLMSVQMVF